MEWEEKILDRIRAQSQGCKWKLSDYQLEATENGLILHNLKTKRADLILDEDSELKQGCVERLY